LLEERISILKDLVRAQAQNEDVMTPMEKKDYENNQKKLALLESVKNEKNDEGQYQEAANAYISYLVRQKQNVSQADISQDLIDLADARKRMREANTPAEKALAQKDLDSARSRINSKKIIAFGDQDLHMLIRDMSDLEGEQRYFQDMFNILRGDGKLFESFVNKIVEANKSVSEQADKEELSRPDEKSADTLPLIEELQKLFPNFSNDMLEDIANRVSAYINENFVNDKGVFTKNETGKTYPSLSELLKQEKGSITEILKRDAEKQKEKEVDTLIDNTANKLIDEKVEEIVTEAEDKEVELLGSEPAEKVSGTAQEETADIFNKINNEIYNTIDDESLRIVSKLFGRIVYNAFTDSARESNLIESINTLNNLLKNKYNKEIKYEVNGSQNQARSRIPFGKIDDFFIDVLLYESTRGRFIDTFDVLRVILPVYNELSTENKVKIDSLREYYNKYLEYFTLQAINDNKKGYKGFGTIGSSKMFNIAKDGFLELKESSNEALAGIQKYAEFLSKGAMSDEQSNSILNNAEQIKKEVISRTSNDYIKNIDEINIGDTIYISDDSLNGAFDETPMVVDDIKDNKIHLIKNEGTKLIVDFNRNVWSFSERQSKQTTLPTTEESKQEGLPINDTNVDTNIDTNVVSSPVENLSVATQEEIDIKKAEIEKLKKDKQEEINNIGIKQKAANFEKLREAKTPEEKLNAINTIERNVLKGMQLSDSEKREIQRVKDKLAMEGYETVDLLGMDYHDGMKVIAVGSDVDENLAEGEEIITEIDSPQINKDGRIIQAAKIKTIKGTKKGGLTKEEWLKEQSKKETRVDKINAKYDEQIAQKQAKLQALESKQITDEKSTAPLPTYEKITTKEVVNPSPITEENKNEIIAKIKNVATKVTNEEISIGMSSIESIANEIMRRDSLTFEEFLNGEELSVLIGRMFNVRSSADDVQIVGSSPVENLSENPALRDVDSTEKALEGKRPTQTKDVATFSLTVQEKELNEYINNFVGLEADVFSLDDLPFGIESLEKDSEQYKSLKDVPIVKAYLSYYNKNKTLKKIGAKTYKSISEAYHKAKAEGSNPELVKAVEDLLATNNNADEKSTAQLPKSLKEINEKDTIILKEDNSPYIVVSKDNKKGTIRVRSLSNPNLYMEVEGVEEISEYRPSQDLRFNVSSKSALELSDEEFLKALKDSDIVDEGSCEI
jgi:hypothetical protein